MPTVAAGNEEGKEEELTEVCEAIPHKSWFTEFSILVGRAWRNAFREPATTMAALSATTCSPLAYNLNVCT
eukprot:m.176027 g.176027  ORF g.176027 m.176027 type:complete len:71 (+) comp15434_c0_seq30:1280-1492(+)